MSQTLTNRVEAIKNTPGTGENVQVSEINSAFDKFDNHFIPACKIHNTTQVIASGGSTALQFSSTNFDSYAARSEGAMADLSNDRITIRKAGLYFVRVNGVWLPGTAAGVLRMDLLINAISGNAVFAPAPAGSISQEVVGFYILAVNDLITAAVTQTTGANRSLDYNTYPNIFNLEAIWMGNVVEV